MEKVNLETIRKSNIRKIFDENEGKWYFSIVDIIEIVANSSDAKNYWKTLKNRLNKRQNELVTRCNQLKMRASDGKNYLTDVADSNTMLELIKIVSEPAVSPFRLWFSRIESFTENSKNMEEEDIEMKLMIDGYETEKEIIVEAMIAGMK